MELFAAYVEQVLCPQLQPGDVVILDKLCIHKTVKVAKLIESCGASVPYLPPYGPDLNPIKMAFAKLKAHLRKAASRSLADLQVSFAHTLSRFVPSHSQAFFKHSQYAST